jgi:3-hydroxymyristoyl/3-hydroxydecanoyl-(acyl carrier protein) dehydratase
MAERFSAFSFVDRITELEPGVRAAGRYAIPAYLPHFPACLVAEAIGQLAAWVAMSHLGFRRRPVAGLAGETLFFGGARPGQVLELAVELDTCEEDAVAYGGSARVDGRPVLELRQCVAPMLPMEEFDAPELVRGDFEVLSGPDAPAARTWTLPRSEVTVIDRVPGKSLIATLQVPKSAPFFGDHFPRRPVFPGTLLLDQQIELALQLAAEAANASTGEALAPSRVTDVKMRSFIAPGQVVEIQIGLQPRDATTSIASLTARVGGKPVATGRLEIVSRAAA